MARAAMGPLKKLAIGSVATTVVGGGVGAFMYKRRLQGNKAVPAEEFNAMQDSSKREFAMSWVKQLGSSRQNDGSSGLKVELLRYTTCPYCGKAKAFLDYFRIPHETVEVDPMFKTQLGDCQYTKVPQMRFGGENGIRLVDSDLIVDELAEKVGIGEQLRDPDVQKWRSWARESLTRHMTVNFNKSLIEAYRGYSYIDQFDTIPTANKLFLKVVGAPIMYIISKYVTTKKLVKAGELKEGDDVRKVFHQQLNNYIEEAGISDTKPFHGGMKPDIADLDIYGVLQSIRGHKVYDDLLQSTNVTLWMARMDHETGKKEYTVESPAYSPAMAINL